MLLDAFARGRAHQRRGWECASIPADHVFGRIDLPLFIIVNEPESRLKVEALRRNSTKIFSQKQNSDNNKIRLIMTHNHADANPMPFPMPISN